MIEDIHPRVAIFDLRDKIILREDFRGNIIIEMH